MPNTKTTSYSKICVFCNEPFVAFRISTLYCSKKCANNARSMPAELKLQLIKRNAGYTLSTNKYAALSGSTRITMTVEERPHQKIDYPEGYSPDNPLGTEGAAALIQLVKERTGRQLSLEDVKLSKIDTEAVAIKLDNSTEFVPNIDDSLPDPDDDGITTSEARISVENQQTDDDNNNSEQPVVVKKGIRKIGGGK